MHWKELNCKYAQLILPTYTLYYIYLYYTTLYYTVYSNIVQYTFMNWKELL